MSKVTDVITTAITEEANKVRERIKRLDGQLEQYAVLQQQRDELAAYLEELTSGVYQAAIDRATAEIALKK